ncbi:MAG TPA: biotin/lipoyl-binding protein, partial [Anaerolineae bacterium]|nr:biotin/lipoyl-binding protein [Anaerolineae bacterium]
MKRRTWIMIGVVVLLIGGVIGIVSTRGQASVPSTVSQTAQVRRATLASAVESSGNIAANEAAMLVFGAGGTVKIVNVEVGDHVKQGEVLAQLDTSKLEVQVARAKQAYLLQQATYSKTVEA